LLHLKKNVEASSSNAVCLIRSIEAITRRLRTEFFKWFAIYRTAPATLEHPRYSTSASLRGQSTVASGIFYLFNNLLNTRKYLR